MEQLKKILKKKKQSPKNIKGLNYENEKKLNGVIPVLQSFFKNGDLDETAQQNHIKFLISKKLVDFLALGTGSEDMNISTRKNNKIAKIFQL